MRAGDALASVDARSDEAAHAAAQAVLCSYVIGDEAPVPRASGPVIEHL